MRSTGTHATLINLGSYIYSPWEIRKRLARTANIVGGWMTSNAKQENVADDNDDGDYDGPSSMQNKLSK